jgi:hypothetical protein
MNNIHLEYFAVALACLEDNETILNLNITTCMDAKNMRKWKKNAVKL